MTRLLFRLLLCLALAGTSLTAAVMHGQMQGATALVICSDGPDGSSPATVMLDAQGRPMPKMPPCPHCLAAQGQALVAAFHLPPAPLTRAEPLPWSQPAFARSQPMPAGQARGPPVLLA